MKPTKCSYPVLASGVVLLSLFLAGCASRPPQQTAVASGPVSKPLPQQTRYKASFDCGQTGSGLQDVICADDPLSGLDRDMAQAYRQNKQQTLLTPTQLLSERRQRLGQLAHV